jgi:hypothetical protein
MMAARLIMSIQFAIMASWLPSTVTSFVGVRSFRTQHETAADTSRGGIHRRSRSSYRFGYDVVVLGAKRDDDMDEEEVEGDPLTNDRREGMAGAFAGLDSLTADDFDDLVPLSSTGGKDSAGSSSSVTIDINMEESAKLFMEMQAELSTLGEEGLYDDIFGDLASDNPDVDAPKTFFKQEEDELTSLVLALDEAGDRLAADAPAASDTMVLNDADGIGIQTSSDKAGGPLTTADVSNDILTQDIKPSLSMDDFISSALKEAVNEIGDSSVMISYTGSGRTEDIAKTAGQLLQNEELRKDIEKIFDVAGEKLRLEVEAIKKEQVRVSIKNCGVHDNRSQHRRLPWKQLHHLSMHFHLTGIGHTEWIKARPRLSIF